jgi:hypothetical protein
VSGQQAKPEATWPWATNLEEAMQMSAKAIKNFCCIRYFDNFKKLNKVNSFYLNFYTVSSTV